MTTYSWRDVRRLPYCLFPLFIRFIFLSIIWYIKFCFKNVLEMLMLQFLKHVSSLLWLDVLCPEIPNTLMFLILSIVAHKIFGVKEYKQLYMLLMTLDSIWDTFSLVLYPFVLFIQFTFDLLFHAILSQ